MENMTYGSSLTVKMYLISFCNPSNAAANADFDLFNPKRW